MKRTVIKDYGNGTQLVLEEGANRIVKVYLNTKKGGRGYISPSLLGTELYTFKFKDGDTLEMVGCDFMDDNMGVFRFKDMILFVSLEDIHLDSKKIVVAK